MLVIWVMQEVMGEEEEMEGVAEAVEAVEDNQQLDFGETSELWRTNQERHKVYHKIPNCPVYDWCQIL